MDDIVSRLLESDEPSVRWRVRTDVLSESEDDPAIQALQEEIRRSARVRSIIGATQGLPAYAKWRGSHWALLSLAALGYPRGDAELTLLRDVVLDRWLAPQYLADADVARITKAGHDSAVPRLGGLSRVHASQQGGALLAILRLGIDDGRGALLADRLRAWQWPDGGWNCDRSPGATMSSVHETLLPMRGLAAYADAVGDASARAAALCAAEVLLSRRVAWRRTSNDPLSAAAVKLHYPAYWHYDLLAGLTGVGEVGLLGDPRCEDALALLESRRRPDGGWRVDARHWHLADAGSGAESVSWGPPSPRSANEWVTTEALAVLAAAGRL